MAVSLDEAVTEALTAAGFTATTVRGPDDPRLREVIGHYEPTIIQPSQHALLLLAEAVAAALDRQGVRARWASGEIVNDQLVATLGTPAGLARVRDALAQAPHWLPAQDSTDLKVESPAVDRAPSIAQRDWPGPPDDSVFYGLGGDFVRFVEPHSEADPVALLLRLFVGFGSIIGRGPHFAVEGDKHHANLFVLLLGRSSKARKGVSEGRVKQVLGPVDPEWAEHRVQSGLSSGEGLVWAVRDPISKREKSKGKGPATYDDVIVDPGITDKRLLVVESEFASVLRVMQRDGNTLSAAVRNAWDGKDVLQTLVKNSPAIATGAHISIVGHSTPEEFVRYLDRTDAANGFGNRYLIACVDRSKLLPEGGDLDLSTLNPLIDALRDRMRFAQDVQRVTFDPEAKQLWHAAYEVLSAGRPGLFGAMTARAEAQCLRLALIYALLDAAPVIRVEHLWAAFGLWSYCEASAYTIFGVALGDPVADELLRALRGHANGMTRTDIRNLFSRNKASNDVERALALLERRGLARPATEATGGRPSERWQATTNTTETTKGIHGQDLPSFRSFLSSLPVPPVVEGMLALSPCRPSTSSTPATSSAPRAALDSRLPPERLDLLGDALERAHRSGNANDIAKTREALRGAAGEDLVCVIEANMLRDLQGKAGG